jgi:hypothetical protein
LFPLIKSIFTKKTKKMSTIKIDEKCNYNCKTVKAVFARSSSLLTNSKKIDF